MSLEPLSVPMARARLAGVEERIAALQLEMKRNAAELARTRNRMEAIDLGRRHAPVINEHYELVQEAGRLREYLRGGQVGP